MAPRPGIPAAFKGLLVLCLLVMLFAFPSLPTEIDPPPTMPSVSLVPPSAMPFLPVAPTPVTLPTNTPIASPTANALPPRISLLFTGVIVPARCVQAAIDARGDADYIYAEVGDLIRAADLAVGTLNTTLSDASGHTGCVETFVLTSDSRSGAAMAAAGFDLVSVATNHIMNCAGASCVDNGTRAFYDTLGVLRRHDILPVGAGLDHAQAMQPVVVTVQGVRFGFVSLGLINAQVFAGEDTPGIAVLNDDNLRVAIAAARAAADVVIAMPHWGPEDIPDPNFKQLHLAQVAVAAGADLVVGNHTHVVQAIEWIDGVDVFYGLGNFVFDQTWDLAHQQGIILQVIFEGARYAGYTLIPTHVDGNGTVHIAGPDEAAQVLQRIEAASQQIQR